MHIDSLFRLGIAYSAFDVVPIPTVLKTIEQIHASYFVVDSLPPHVGYQYHHGVALESTTFMIAQTIV